MMQDRYYYFLGIISNKPFIINKLNNSCLYQLFRTLDNWEYSVKKYNPYGNTKLVTLDIILQIPSENIIKPKAKKFIKEMFEYMSDKMLI